MVPWLWGLHCLDTLVPYNVCTSSSGASWLANSAGSAKGEEVLYLLPFNFLPLYMEILGAWGLLV